MQIVLLHDELSPVASSHCSGSEPTSSPQAIQGILDVRNGKPVLTGNCVYTPIISAEPV